MNGLRGDGPRDWMLAWLGSSPWLDGGRPLWPSVGDALPVFGLGGLPVIECWLV